MLDLRNWTAPAGAGQFCDEQLVKISPENPVGQTQATILILPPLFDEANLMRRQLMQTMRQLAARGISSVLPDLPGCNESLFPQDRLGLPILREAAQAAASQLKATHCLAVRNAALFAPAGLPGWRYAPAKGNTALRKMMRAEILSAQEAGRETTLNSLQEKAQDSGITLGGWALGAQFYIELLNATIPETDAITEITQGDVGGAALWLRAEAGQDNAQAAKLADIITQNLAHQP